MDDRNGETYTLCVADTFFGDISGRVGKVDILGDPGHWAKWPVKRRPHKSMDHKTYTVMEVQWAIEVLTSTLSFNISFGYAVAFCCGTSRAKFNQQWLYRWNKYFVVKCNDVNMFLSCFLFLFRSVMRS